MSTSKIINKIYEKIAYHVKYTINDDGIIIKEERNNNFDMGRLNIILISLLIFIIFVFTIGLTSYELHKISQDKVYQSTFYVNQLCFRGEDLSECFNIHHNQPVKIYLDEQNDIKTLFISGD